MNDLIKGYALPVFPDSSGSHNLNEEKHTGLYALRNTLRTDIPIHPEAFPGSV